MDAVRHALATRGERSAESLVFMFEDDDEGLHYLASGAELVRMAKIGKTEKDPA